VGADGAAVNLARLLLRLGCATILIEENYIDRDFKAEYSAFYSKRFNLPSACCTRLHFFKAKPTKYAVLVSPAELDPLMDELSYLGFCVVRPTEFFRIGRTIIKFSAPNDSLEHYVTCSSWYKTHLLGREFKVYGMPFIQQDTQVGACAHAVLWMVGRYLHALGHCPEVSMPKINEYAKSRQPRGRYYPAHDGLVSHQMLDALHEMGLSPIHYNSFGGTDKGRSDLIASLVYFYVESGLPVIICFERHVILAIGHTLNPVKKSRAKLSDKIPGFIVHDDISQPYGIFPIVGNQLYDLQKVVELIAVLPNSVHLQGEFAEKLAMVMLAELADPQSQLAQDCASAARDSLVVPKEYRLRTYLMKATEFLTEIQNGIADKSVPEDVGNLLLCLEYPIYIWISEIFEVFPRKSEATDKCVGKFIFDSTAAGWDKSVMAILMERIAFLFDRQHLKEQPLIQPFGEKWQFYPRNTNSFVAGATDC
jgi:hypothetical protein